MNCIFTLTPFSSQESTENPGQEIIAEYQGLMQELQPLQQQVMQSPDIQNLQIELQDAALVVMEELDPEVNNIIERFNSLRMQMIEMQQQGQ